MPDDTDSTAPLGIRLRKLFLRVMLGALAAGALCGVLAVLTSGSEVIVRVVGTMIVTAIGAAFMMGAARLIDDADSRPAGLLAMAITGVEFLLSMLLIWNIARLLGFPSSVHWQLAGSTGAIFGCGIASIVFLQLCASKTTSAAGRTGLALTLLALIAMLAAIWLDDSGKLDDHLWGTAGVLGAFGMIAVASLVGHGTGDGRHWRWIGVAAATVTGGLLLRHLWFESNESAPTLMAFLIGLGLVVGHANLVLRCPLTSTAQKCVAATAVGAACSTWLLIVVVVYQSQYDAPDSLLARLAGASAIVAGCASLAILVFAMINRKYNRPRVLAEVARLSLTCPGCRSAQTITLPDASCPVCRLRFHIKVEEPRCHACDYLLYMVPGEKCPECGTPITASTPDSADAENAT